MSVGADLFGHYKRHAILDFEVSFSRGLGFPDVGSLGAKNTIRLLQGYLGY